MNGITVIKELDKLDPHIFIIWDKRNKKLQICESRKRIFETRMDLSLNKGDIVIGKEGDYKTLTVHSGLLATHQFAGISITQVNVTDKIRLDWDRENDRLSIGSITDNKGIPNVRMNQVIGIVNFHTDEPCLFVDVTSPEDSEGASSTGFIDKASPEDISRYMKKKNPKKVEYSDTYQ